jgi:hypothetical protein
MLHLHPATLTNYNRLKHLKSKHYEKGSSILFTYHNFFFSAVM